MSLVEKNLKQAIVSKFSKQKTDKIFQCFANIEMNFESINKNTKENYEK